MQCLTTFAIYSLYFTQIPACAMYSEHKRQTNCYLDPPRDFVPMGSDKQHDPANDKDCAHERKYHQGFAGFFLQFEVSDDLLALFRGN